MPAYLDNIWGDQQVIKGFGDALNNNLASLGELRLRQRQYDQQNALNAAYFALERQKQMMMQPGMQAETGLRNAETDKIRRELAVQGEQQSRLKALNDAVQERFLQANPSPGGFAPQGPGTQPGQPPMQMPPPTGPMAPPPWQGPQMMSDPDQARMTEARIRGMLTQQAAQQPSEAGKILSGDVLRPGDQRVNPMTQQTIGDPMPYQFTPGQMLQELLGQQRIQLGQGNLEEKTRHNVAEETKVKPLTYWEQKMEDAEKKKKGGGTPSNNIPKAGEVRQGYKFRGGNPGNPDSWEKVQ